MAEDNPPTSPHDSATLEELIARVGRLEAMVDALPVLVSYVDRGHRYRFNNRAYEEWFGHAREEITGRHLRDVLGEEAYTQLKPQIERALRGERFSFETRAPYKSGGPRDVHIEYVPDRGPDGTVAGYLAMIQDITDRRSAEQELTALNETLESRVAEEIDRRSQAEEALRQTQKMETVGQLSGGIAHDFNNLLQVIHGNLTILQHALPEGEAKWRRSVANALTGTERAAALTQRLLAFSRRQPLDARPLDVNAMIGDMTELLHRTLGETIRIETRLAPGSPSAHIDGNQLENALLNLAINARDAMAGGGGRLEIETGFAELDQAYSELHPDATPGAFVRIAVRDNGRGMSADVLGRAIEPFFSTKEVGQGTGLGLSMVYGFIKQSGGSLALSSAEGQGTTVELFLPCSDTAPEAKPAASSEKQLPRGRGERILVCEDDSDVRRFSSETLIDLGYEVIEAADAGSALDLLSDGQRVDLLFTDVVLPGGKTGAELVREAQAAQPGLKVLFTTGYARSALDEPHSAGDKVELLAKPFGVDELAAKLRAILD